MNKTYCLTTDTKLPVIEKILSNSNAFHEFPKTIISALTQLIKENLIAKNEFEYWKELYEKIDEKNIPTKDKKIIQTVFDAELEDEKEQAI